MQTNVSHRSNHRPTSGHPSKAKSLKVAFDIPQTEFIRIEYKANGVLYSTNVQRPRDNYALQAFLLTRRVGMSQVIGVYPSTYANPNR